nr:nonribosomal peptide synthetase 1 [Quercus suber]
MTTQVATLLSQLGVGPEVMVPVCFEKSTWAIIAMLGVMKAGGAFVSLDPSHAATRRKALVEESGAHVMLVSPSTADDCRGMTEHMVELSRTLMSQLPAKTSVDSVKTTRSSPANAACIIFTSGSTGKPKSIVLEHSAMCTSAEKQKTAFEINQESRVLQFSSYVFDVSLSEIFTTLSLGGTICVPTDVERLQNIAEFIRTARVNTAMLTPSFVQTFTPSEVPTLKTIVLGGETPTRANLNTWFGHVKLMNGYGPAETCIYSTTYVYQSPNESPAILGSPTCGSCWIVDPDDHNRLAPIGCTGELLIQSHGLARGYAGNEAATARSFIDHVSWLPSSATDHAPRFYKSGDLVRYRSDGMLEYLGRRDTQIKLRGLRIELGAIEAGIKQMLPKAEHVVVDVVGQGVREALVAFVSFDDKAAEAEGGVAEELAEDLLAMDDGMRAVLVVLADDLKTILPPYMVPSLFLPLRCMPYNTSMKLDRKRLRELAGGLTQERLTTFSLASRTWVAPTTTMEFRLREMWAQVLKITAEEIGKNDSFLQIGGDSISAIQMVTAARKAGITLTIKNIFDDARLSKVSAQAVEATEDDESHVVEPFSLLPDGKAEAIKSQLRAQCALSDTQSIEDAYPCTSLQEGLLALAVKQPGSYMARHVYRIPAHVDLARFTAAWERTVELCGILRTRIATIEGASIQALIAGDMAWEPTSETSLDSFMNLVSALRMGYGSRLCRYAIIEETNMERYFVLVIHHAVFDGWSFGLVFNTFQEVYDGASLPAVYPYAGFVRYAVNVDAQAASTYWIDQLRDARRASFPPQGSSEHSGSVSRVMKTSIPFPRMTDSSITKATILRTAWAAVLARYCDSDDICFATSISGRHAPVSGIEQMVGPTLATVPVRIKLDREQKVSEMLRQVQAQATEMVAYEQFGLHNISRLGPNAKEACEASSLMAIQPMPSAKSDEDASKRILAAPVAGTYEADEALEGYFTYPLVIQAATFDEHVELNLTYHSDVLSEARLTALSNHFMHMVQQLLTQDSRQFGALSLAGEWDLHQALEWNGPDATQIPACMHDLIAQQVSRNPDREAVHSSNGSLTYADLERMSTQLAAYLSQFGVGPEIKVPVCFEKSIWTIVAMLGIMKAGGAFVPLDPSHATSRRQELVKEVDAHVMLVSTSMAASCQGMVEHTIELSSTLVDQFSTPAAGSSTPQHRANPENAAYVIFTSGSTGKPKTIVVEHSALCTSASSQGTSFKMDEGTRFLQFSSYVFDACVTEIFTTLMFGGTVCVPNEAERLQDIVGFVTSASVNTAMLTPSFVNTFSPDEVPTLKTLVLGGEAATKANLATWFGRVKLMNAYGPAEAVVICATYEYQSVNELPTTIGTGTYNSCWIVDPDNHERLAPIGCTGELLVRGNGLARGYAGNPTGTAQSFINNVSWLPSSGASDASRFYRTGDLVRYRPDGMLEYVGRRDTQIKLRGQRIELGAIEAGIKQMLPNAEHVAVDIVGEGAREALVAFVSFVGGAAERDASASKDLTEELLSMDDAMRAVLVVLADNLKTLLPPYMVPGLFLPLRCMPFGTSMKLDRKRLRELASGLAQEQLTTFTLASRTWVAPTTAMELRLREVWAQVLHVTAEEIGKNDSFLSMDDAMRAVLVVLADNLKTLLPPYMVPGLFLPLRCMPFGTSMKLDRKRLRELASGLAQEQLTTFTLASRTWVAPTTAMELRLREVWAQVLHVTAEEIGKNDSFLQIGGDSISAIQAVSAAKQAGVTMTVKDIFEDPRLSSVAARSLNVVDNSETQQVEPFSLLPGRDAEAIKTQILNLCGLPKGNDVEDAYPCTSLQEGYMVLSDKQPGSYIGQMVTRLPKEVDVARFKQAWEQTLELCHNLRTRIVIIDGVPIQTVIRNEVAWESTAEPDIDTMMRASQEASMTYGTRLCRYALVEAAQGGWFFVLTLHHAINDGVSLPMAIDTLYHLYQGLEPPAVRSFASFIRYTNGLDHYDASYFWKTQLHEAQLADYPQGTRSAEPCDPNSNASGLWRHPIALSLPTRSPITKATILRAAWAMVLARNCNTTDVCFGATVSGRSAPVADIERVAGPAIATVPVRIRLNEQQTVLKFLSNVQSQAFETVPYEQFGLQNISSLSENAKQACAFPNLLVIHPTQNLAFADQSTSPADDAETESFTSSLRNRAAHRYLDHLVSTTAASYVEGHAMRGYWNYRLIVNCNMTNDGVELNLVYNKAIISATQLRLLSAQFEAVVQQLVAHDDMLLSTISLSSA